MRGAGSIQNQCSIYRKMKLLSRLGFTLLLLSLVVMAMPYTIGCSKPTTNNVFLELLEIIPADAADARYIQLIDYERIWQVYKIDLRNENGKKISRDTFINTIMDKLNSGGSKLKASKERSTPAEGSIT